MIKKSLKNIYSVTIQLFSYDFIKIYYFKLTKFLLKIIMGNAVSQIHNRGYTLLKRIHWLYRNVPIDEYTIVSRNQSDLLSMDEKELIVADLIESYNEAVKLDSKNEHLSDIWKGKVLSSKDIVLLLEDNDQTGLMMWLENMFKQKELNGISMGDEFITNSGRHPYLSYTILECLVSLGEYLGVIRTECPAIGDVGYALRNGAESLVQAIEYELGFEFNFPGLFGSYGIEIGNRLITTDMIEHIYVAHRLSINLKRFIADINKYKILEIGGGFGDLPHWLSKMIQIKHFLILDLPLTNVYQGWFLSNIYGRDRVALFNHFLKGTDLSNKDIFIVPVNSYKYWEDIEFNCVFNQNSFPEMPQSIVEDYIRFCHQLLFNNSGFLYSYNQEAQVLVPEIITNIGGFKRQFRERSWTRRGYVEELYTKTD